MELLLIRHAIAEERDSDRWPDDSRRPLTERGRKRFAAVARVLADRIASPTVVYSSRYVRAWQTAMILQAEAGWPAPTAMPELEFAAGIDIITAINAADDASQVALVGHEPTMGHLASMLLAGNEDAMEIDVKKGGAICVACDRPVRAGEARLRWYVTPKMAGAGVSS